MAGRPLAAPSWASAPIECLQHKRAGGQEVIAASRSVLGVRIHPPLAPEGCDEGLPSFAPRVGGDARGRVASRVTLIGVARPPRTAWAALPRPIWPSLVRFAPGGSGSSPVSPRCLCIQFGEMVPGLLDG